MRSFCLCCDSLDTWAPHRLSLRAAGRVAGRRCRRPAPGSRRTPPGRPGSSPCARRPSRCSRPGHAPLRVLHLCDVHLTPGQTRKQAWVRALAALEPDLVISTGDNLAHRDAVPAVLDAYGGLLDVPGVFVFGSNDYYEPTLRNPLRYLLPDDGARNISTRQLPWPDLQVAFLERGWLDLTNRFGRLERGRDDLRVRRRRRPAPRPRRPRRGRRAGRRHRRRAAGRHARAVPAGARPVRRRRVRRRHRRPHPRRPGVPARQSAR